MSPDASSKQLYTAPWIHHVTACYHLFKMYLNIHSHRMDMKEHNSVFILSGSLVSWPEAWGMNIFEI